MSSWMTPISEKFNSALNVAKSIGPLLISQSDSASEAYTRHLSRLANVEAIKELIHQEISIYSKNKEKLLQQFIDSDELERTRIKRDLEYITSNLRHLGIVDGAMNHLFISQELVDQVSENQDTPRLAQEEISSHWLDKFNELSKVRNEDWRAELLSRALAAESSRPGTVSPRALWLLGTLEEPLFKAFATILDLCSSINGELIIPFVPGRNEAFTEQSVPNCELGDKLIGNLVYMLDDAGVLAGASTTENLLQGSHFLAAYNSHHYYIECTSCPLVITGTILTHLGSAIASLYPKKNQSTWRRDIQSLD
jgi:Protein of unknown function (DUF2806)